MIVLKSLSIVVWLVAVAAFRLFMPTFPFRNYDLFGVPNGKQIAADLALGVIALIGVLVIWL